MSDFADDKARFTVSRPDSIREKVAAWAFEGTDSTQDAISRLESIDCAACCSPAPIYNRDMAREIAWHWQEIDAALDSYRDAAGIAWAPQEGQGVLTYLWFAYEWIAHELAAEIRHALGVDDDGPSPRNECGAGSAGPAEARPATPADLTERQGTAATQPGGGQRLGPAIKP